jgi:hypothetical protein
VNNLLTELLPLIRGDNSLSWTELAVKMNETAKERGLDCRAFTKANTLGKMRSKNTPLSLPAVRGPWTQVEKSLLYECAVNLTGKALEHRLNDVAQEHGLDYRKFTVKSVRTAITRTKKGNDPRLPPIPRVSL